MAIRSHMFGQEIQGGVHRATQRGKSTSGTHQQQISEDGRQTYLIAAPESSLSG